MDKLFEILLKQLQSGNDCLLATIIASSGSTPRSAGSYMLLNAKERLFGTIGGGNLEYQATLKGQQQIVNKENFIFDYVLTTEHSAELGMICGGQCKVLFYYFASDQENITFAENILAIAKKKKPYYLILPLGQGKAFFTAEERFNIQRGIIKLNNAKYYVEQFSYDGKVYIFGGGHLAQEVVPLLDHLDFQCVVIDDRPEFADKKLFPQAYKVILADFGKLKEHIAITSKDYVAVMTRGHVHDADVERFVLNTPAKYIGVVGSRRKAAITRNVLLQEGFSKEQLDRIITPIGIDIKSETPAEIAVSIAAQLIERRANE